MVKSMTGYGRSDFSIGGESFSLEVKSLNHRFVDIYLRMPDRFSSLEGSIRDKIKGRFSRGAFSITLTAVHAEAPALKLNLPLARFYMDAAAGLQKELGVKCEVDGPFLLSQRDMLTSEKKGPFGEADWEALEKGLDAALDGVDKWRVQEGESLKRDLLSRLLSMEGHLSKIDERVPAALENYRNRLKEGIERLIGEKADESRILLEAAIFAERSDISEETVRTRSHIGLFRKYLDSGEPAGKKLDFLCQELGREINTIGSKSDDTFITQTIVEIKGEIEKIREQVQNIE